MIPILTIPYLNRGDLLARLLESIDHPVDRLVIVDNSGIGMARGIAANFRAKCRHLHIIEHPNAGVAASWNEAIKLFPAPWWLIVNNDIQFTPGDLAKLAAAAEAAKDADIACLYYHPGAMFSCFIATAQGVANVGMFDENIYPAYCEDNDWFYRMKLLGWRWQLVADVHAVHGDERCPGSCTINSDPALPAKNHRTHAGNFEYYHAKWGGNIGSETFTHPFNNPNWPVWAWRFDPALRAKQQW